MKDSIITLKNVGFKYDDNVILNDVNLDIKTDTFTVIIGHSGSGKSILMKIMATLLYPDTGNVRIFGEDVTGYEYMKLVPVKKRIGYAFQDGALLSNLSVEENLLLPLDFHYKEIGRKEKLEKIYDFLKKLMIENTMHQRPAQLSSGEKKIISIVRAMIVEPEILFLDEPLAFMDATIAKTIIVLINEYAIKENTTVVCVSNSKRIILDNSEEIAILDNGKILIHEKKETIIGMDPEKRHTIINDILGYK
jgi:ABC-type transporter Mla maintaining outer membrane lipid asymmetry ATPase subunit MlaF